MIRIFIASAKKYAEHEPVLEYSILRHASQPVEINWMRPGENGLQPSGCTSFTNFRFAVPELAGHQGWAVYCDVDMLFLHDVASLYEYRKPGRWACLQDGQTEVSVIDCTLKFPAKEEIHRFKKWALLPQAPLHRCIPMDWNVTDSWTPGAKLIHFTDLSRQPWFTPDRRDKATDKLNEYQNDYAARQGMAVA